jgi:hypothetical protein
MVRWQFNKKTLPSPCSQRDENVNFHLCFRGTTLFHPEGCPFDAITSQLCYGSARLPLLCFHGSRSAVSSASLSQCLAPTGISPQAKESAYYSASLRYNGCIIAHFFPFVNIFSEIFPSRETPSGQEGVGLIGLAVKDNKKL